jgi:magnesium transporter
VLIDDLRVREVLLFPVTTRVGDLMNRRFAALRATDDQRVAIEMFRREDRTALPVIDDNGILIGIVPVDDVLDAAQDMATRDLQRFGGSAALGEPYMAVSTARMIRKRARWLVVLFLGEMLTATAMGLFEQEMARAVVLALFVPLIISSGGRGNCSAASIQGCRWDSGIFQELFSVSEAAV